MRKTSRNYSAIGLIGGILTYTGLFACSTYSDPEDSNLIAKSGYPTENDVCVTLDSNSVTKPFESNNHFLIACPAHEEGAISDRKSQQEAKIITTVDKWVIFNVPIVYESSPSKSTGVFKFDCKSNPSQYNVDAPTKVSPLFRNSVVSTDIDFITSDDISEFIELKFIERSKREMPDKRSDILFDNEAFVFEAVYSDAKIGVWLHSDFKDLQIAEGYARKLTGPIGKLPQTMRKGLKHVVVHDGDETASGEHLGNFFVVYSKNMDTRISNNDLEETVFHESVHATMDYGCEEADSGWNQARVKDNSFITDYAADKPEKEDLAESALFAYTMIKNPGRLAPNIESWIRTNIPNRFSFFETIF